MPVRAASLRGAPSTSGAAPTTTAAIAAAVATAAPDAADALVLQEAWVNWLLSLPARTHRPAVDLSARAGTAPAAMLGYTLSASMARSLTGYDDAQLSMADALLHGRRVARGMPSVAPAWRLAPCDADSLLPRVLGEEPFCALSALIAQSRFGLTMSDVRVATFYPTRGGRLLASGVAFLVVAPGVARFFDHEGQDRGRELDAVAAFIDRRRDTVRFIDALAPERERLLSFADCDGPAAVRDRLLALCRGVSTGFHRPGDGRADGAGTDEPGVRVVVSSREASFGIPGQPLHFPSLATRRALHRLPDRSLLLPRDWPRGDVPVPAATAGALHATGAAQRRLHLQKNQIAAFGFADLGLRSPFLPMRPASPIRSRPAVLPSIHDALRAAALPFLRALDDTARQARIARAAGIAGPHAPDWPALEAFSRRTAAGMRTLMATLEESGARGDVDALRVCLGVLRRFEVRLLEALGSQAELCAWVTLARWRLEDAETALERVASGESPDATAPPSATRRVQRQVLNAACAALFPRGVATVGSALSAVATAGAAMTPAPFGDLARAVIALHARPRRADMPVADMPVADMPVADMPVAETSGDACARDVLLANIDAWVEDVYDLLFLRTPDAVHRALFAARRLEDATRLLPGAGPAAADVLAATGAVTGLLERTVAELQRIDVILAR